MKKKYLKERSKRSKRIITKHFISHIYYRYLNLEFYVYFKWYKEEITDYSKFLFLKKLDFLTHCQTKMRVMISMHIFQSP